MAHTVEIKLPSDQNSNPVQVLSWDQSTSVKIGTVTTTSANVALNAAIGDGDVVRIACTIDAYLAWGFGSAATATSSNPLFTSGVEYMRVPDGATHISALRAGSADGVLCVTKCV